MFELFDHVPCFTVFRVQPGVFHVVLFVVVIELVCFIVFWFCCLKIVVVCLWVIFLSV